MAHRRTTLSNIQGLRGIAAPIVVFAHLSGPHGFEDRVFGSRWTSSLNLPANMGVDLFFVISGLMMVLTTWRTFDDPGSARRFLLRRAARIYPLYWLVNTALLGLFWVSPHSVRFEDGQHASMLTVLESYLLLPQRGRLPVLVAWSLIYELYFYLVFAVALMLGRSRLPWVIVGWVAVIVTVSTIASHATDPYVAVLADPMSLEFVLGLLIGLAAVHGRYVVPRAVLAAGILSFGACLVPLGLSGWEAFPSNGVRVALFALPAALVVYGAIGVEVRHGSVLPSVVRRVGDASYSSFLTHVPLLTLLAVLLAGHLPTTPWVHALALPAALLLAIGGALLCHVVLERPLQTTARRLLQQAPRAGAPSAEVAAAPSTRA